MDSNCLENPGEAAFLTGRHESDVWRVRAAAPGEDPLRGKSAARSLVHKAPPIPDHLGEPATLPLPALTLTNFVRSPKSQQEQNHDSQEPSTDGGSPARRSWVLWLTAV